MSASTEPDPGPSHQESGLEQTAWRWLTVLLGVVTAVLVIAVAVVGYSAVLETAGRYDDPSPPWMYVVCGAGSYVLGPYMAWADVRFGWGLRWRSWALSAIGSGLFILALYDRADTDRQALLAGLVATLVVLCPQVCATALVTVLRRESTAR
jgi:hypothetical protein